ncbi:Podocin [Orchesella cincta]|uniref:Podocin n=1 Tax=Orchesella cincta TaxID=48709 RepID=A0A1D2MLI3_ORCCI|nr:Podocin [Orchesella cincta]
METEKPNSSRDPNAIRMPTSSNTIVPLESSNERTHLHASGIAGSEPEGSGLIEILATLGSIVLLVITLPIAIFFCFKGGTVSTSEAVICRTVGLRRGWRAARTGIFFIPPAALIAYESACDLR